MGRPAARLGRARQPGPRRGSPRVGPAHSGGIPPHPRRAARRLGGGRCRNPSRRPGTKTCTPRSRTGSPGDSGLPASGCTPAARGTTRSPATSGSFSRTVCFTCRTRRWTWWTACSRSPDTSTVSGRDTPTSGAPCRPPPGLWAAAFAEGLLDTVEALPALWPRVDRSPLGSAAGYGVPLPLKREAAARALGFAGLEHNVASVQRAAASSRPRCSSGAPSWATTSPSSPAT